jgi:hypothetical protein
MKLIKLLIILVLLLPFTIGAQPLDRGALTCDEPFLNSDGTPLTDLKELVCFYRIPSIGVWTECFRKDATSLTGGGVMQDGGTTDCIVTEKDIKETVDFKCVACDLAGNCSVDSNIAMKFIDTSIAPGPPGCQVN